MLGVVDSTPADDDPFSHVLLRNFLPDDTYSQLLA
jgi:hypothetical protein